MSTSTTKTLDKQTTHFLHQCCRFTNLAKKGNLSEIRKGQLAWNYSALAVKLELDGRLHWQSMELALKTGDFNGLFNFFEQTRLEYSIEIPSNYDEA